MVEQYNLNGLLAEMLQLSSQRLSSLELASATTSGLFAQYAHELGTVFLKNKQVEDAMKAEGKDD